MKYAYFPGCKLDFHLPEYDRSVRAVTDRLGIRLVDLEFNCCGYPAKDQSIDASLYAAARNMAIAGAAHLSIMTPCKCCFGQLKHAAHHLKRDEKLRTDVNRMLKKEGLEWKPNLRIRHLLQVLDQDVGAETIQKQVIRPLDGMKIAAHYGCHALRPSNIVQFDDPLSPTIFERLIDALGAETVSWPLRLECCGHPQWEKNNRLSVNLMNKKLEDASQSGAEIICTACTYCQIQFDGVRGGLPEKEQKHMDLKSVLYSQLLWEALGGSPFPK